MTPTALRSARHALGLSARGLALALGMTPRSGRTVRRWEAGASPISGPVAAAVRALLREAGLRLDGDI